MQHHKTQGENRICKCLSTIISEYTNTICFNAEIHVPTLGHIIRVIVSAVYSTYGHNSQHHSPYYFTLVRIHCCLLLVPYNICQDVRK